MMRDSFCARIANYGGDSAVIAGLCAALVVAFLTCELVFDLASGWALRAHKGRLAVRLGRDEL
jgi:hypothetical protein